MNGRLVLAKKDGRIANKLIIDIGEQQLRSVERKHNDQYMFSKRRLFTCPMSECPTSECPDYSFASDSVPTLFK
jgi:hypothetical protein